MILLCILAMLRVFRLNKSDRFESKDPRVVYFNVKSEREIFDDYINKRPVPKVPHTQYSLYVDNYILMRDSKIYMKTIHNESYSKEVDESEALKAIVAYYEPRDLPAVVFDSLKSKNHADNVEYIYEDFPGTTLQFNLVRESLGNTYKHPVLDLAVSLNELKKECYYKGFYYMFESDLFFASVISFGSVLKCDSISEMPNSYSDIAALFKSNDNVVSIEKNMLF